MKYCLLIVFIFLADISYSQGLLEQRLRRRAEKILEKVIKEKGFVVVVKIEESNEKEKVDQLPYMPKSLNNQGVADLQKLVSSVQKVTLSIQLYKKIDSQILKRLSQLLVKHLFLNTDRGDQIDFEIFNFIPEKSEFKDTEAFKTMARRYAELELKHSLLQRKLEETQTAQDRARDKKTGESLDNSDKQTLTTLEWAIIAALAAFALILLVAIAVFYIASKRVSSSVGEGLTVLSKSIGNLNSGTDYSEATIQESTGMESVNTDSAKVELNIEAIKTSILGINETIRERSEDCRNILIGLIQRISTKNDGIELVSFMLEALEKDFGKSVFNSLSADLQSELVNYLRRGRSSRNKYEILSDVVQIMEMNFLVIPSSNDDGPNSSNEIHREINRLSIQQVIVLFENLEFEEIQATLKYIEPFRIGEAISTLKQANEKVWEDLIQATSKIAKTAQSKEVERSILDKIKVVKDDDSGQRSIFLEILDQMDSDSQNSLLSHIEIDEPSIAKQLEGSFVTVSSFLKLSPDTLELTLKVLSSKELAALALHSESFQERIRNGVEASLWELIEEDIKSLTSESSMRKNQMIKRTNDKVVKKIKSLLNEFTSSEVFLEEKNGSNGANDQNGDKVA